ncbi:MAG: glutamate--tRNA ligase [Pirellulaceae bacterium]
MKIRTRFAPSPTGYLHIGGVRTALFNWLLSRQTGGQFILRIDDTDLLRNQEEALQPIIDGFRWLGIDWDEGPEVGGPYAPYFQSQRLSQYQAAVKKLLACGAAYRDYATPEETNAERTAAEKEKRDFLYSRQWMAENDEQAARFEAEGRKCVVRLKMPRSGTCEFTDAIRGPVSFDWAREQDHVVQRNDGTCLYHLASVVDDFDFQITHVVRAIEHLSNTPRQIFIAQSLGYPLPVYGHIPFVAEPGSKTKMSKRKIEQYLKNKDFKNLMDSAQFIAEKIGLQTTPETFNPVLVDFYKQVGYLPEAINNYLLLLGWSLDDHTEEFSRAEMIQQFSLDRVVKSEASFDPAKLAAFQHRYMNRLSVAEKVELAMPFLLKARYVAADTAEIRTAVAKIVAAAADRLIVAGDILRFDEFFVDDAQLTMDEKAFEKRLVKVPQAGHLLNEFRKILTSCEPFTAANLEAGLNGFAETQNIKQGDIMNPLRIALSGKAGGIGVFEMLEILGRKKSLNRIELTLQRLAQAFSSPGT